MLGGVPYQTAYPEWYNLGGRAINFSSLVRWDSEKRRVFASLSSPVEGRADRVISFFVDARNENWNLANTFSGSLSPVTDLKFATTGGGSRVAIRGQRQLELESGAPALLSENFGT